MIAWCQAATTGCAGSPKANDHTVGAVAFTVYRTPAFSLGRVESMVNLHR